MSLKKNLHWLLYILFVASCAKQTSPTGGPKDTIPPSLVSSDPRHGTINFRGEGIRLEFSEMIALNNPNDQIIITPSIGKDFEATSRKNAVILQFNAPLADSTTYTFNFRESIEDVTEKNPARNLQLAVSTGTYIDSLSIQGTIRDLLTGEALEDATVAIHPPNDTFSILAHPALYFTKTDKKGQFRIDNLKPQTYYVYAMHDRNRNLIADSRTEPYGFLRDSIRLSSDTSEIDIGLVKLDIRQPAITSARPYNSYFNIKTNKNLKSFDLSAPDSTTLFFGFGEDAANIRVYNTIEPRDSIALRLIAYDSAGNTLDSTLYAKFSDREVTPEPFSLNIRKSSLNAHKGVLEATIAFTKPVKEINFDSLFFQVDSVTAIPITARELTYDEPTKTLSLRKLIDKKLFPGNSAAEDERPAPPSPDLNQLVIGKGAFISAENDSSKSATQNLDPLYLSQLSTIIFDIRTDEKTFVVQLLDKTLSVIQEKSNVRRGQFDDLTAGQYSLRVIVDVNGNGAWDPGNYERNQEPEPIIYYKDEKSSTMFNLKANWEIQLAPLLIKS